MSIPFMYNLLPLLYPFSVAVAVSVLVESIMRGPTQSAKKIIPSTQIEHDFDIPTTLELENLLELATSGITDFLHGDY